MRLLAFESSAKTASVALSDGGRLLSSMTVDAGRTHSEILLPMAEDLLRESKLSFADIDGWQQVSQEQVIERSPDYIVLVTGMGETAVDEVMARAGWEGITAIQNGAVYNADSYAMTRPAPRLMEAVVDLYNFLYGTNE